MQDCTNIIHDLTDTLYVGEIIVTPKTELVLPCAVEPKTGIIMATAADMPVNDEDAARKLIEEQNAAA